MTTDKENIFSTISRETIEKAVFNGESLVPLLKALSDPKEQAGYAVISIATSLQNIDLALNRIVGALEKL